MRLGAYYFVPDPDGNGTIFKDAPFGSRFPRVFQCECNPADAERLMLALHLLDLFERDCPAFLRSIKETANSKCKCEPVTLAEPKESAA